MDDIKFTKYKIVDHAKGVQKLIDLYLIPAYLKRLHIKDEERAKYSHIEDVLDPKRIMDSAFEFTSYVAQNKNGEIIGCFLYYIVTKSTFQETWIDGNKKFANDSKLPEPIRNYCQHLHSLYDGLTHKIFDQNNINEIIYAESVITAPEYRGHHLADVAGEKLEREFGGKFHIFVDSMMPIELYMKKTETKNYWSPVGTVFKGYITLRKVLSYDRYVVKVCLSTPELMITERKSKL